MAAVFVSPRKRAQQTLDPFFGDDSVDPGIVTAIGDIAEWDYGHYEGLTAAETRRLRKERGLDGEREWSVWRDGCEGGE